MRVTAVNPLLGFDFCDDDQVKDGRNNNMIIIGRQVIRSSQDFGKKFVMVVVIAKNICMYIHILSRFLAAHCWGMKMVKMDLLLLFKKDIQVLLLLPHFFVT